MDNELSIYQKKKKSKSQKNIYNHEMVLLKKSVYSSFNDKQYLLGI